LSIATLSTKGYPPSGVQECRDAGDVPLFASALVVGVLTSEDNTGTGGEEGGKSDRTAAIVLEASSSK
jgi:hypothetical protein